MKFGIIGGDMRIARLCSLLINDGHEVSAFALEKAALAEPVVLCAGASEAVRGAECVILPLPVTGQKGYLNSPLSSGDYAIEDILDALCPNQVICAGRVDAQTAKAAAARGLSISDYFQREELAVCNAVATAEGALGLIMQETPTTVWDSEILVVGFGRIGKLLAHRLRGLGANVSVSARSHGDMAWIRALGYTSLDTRSLDGKLSGFDVVVNTVPAPVLGESRLRELKDNALCMDLASKPGGMDFAAAGRLGVRALWALSLPGEVAPVSAGVMIRDTIYNILGEQ